MADFAGQYVDFVTFLEGRTAEQLIAGGFLAQAQVAVVGVAQYSLNSVDVGFNTFPLTFDEFTDGDALNPSTYTISRTDGEDAPFILSVECVGPGVIRIYVDAIFVEGVEYTVTVSGVTSAAGETLGPANSGSFEGIGRGVATSIIDPSEPRTDILNAVGADSIEDGLRYDPSGDLANQSGRSYLRKRLLRRITTVMGGFFHLPGYGAGQRLKTRISGSKVARMEKQIQAQCEQEPDVRSVSVSATIRSASIVRVVVTVLDAEGDSFKVSTQVDLTGETP